MTTVDILGEFFADLDEYPGASWLVRVVFPFPEDASDLPQVTALLAAALESIAKTNRTSVRHTGPTSWALTTSTPSLLRVFILLEGLFRRVLNGPAGAIDITPINASVAASTDRTAHIGGTL